MFVVGASQARVKAIPSVTARTVVPEIFSNVALIVVEPAATDVANPLEPAALLMAATASFDEAQVRL